ncbi:hypothetical protein [Oryza sativa Japonica Group]|uniref:Uncharacterized protein n=1 Tax=Oryza sativa subsp. japonica TaxID=39947 RepID=Q9ARW9_ORYSJ|nr:hypothetical protein [Oryza sativa Japonica Group]
MYASMRGPHSIGWHAEGACRWPPNTMAIIPTRQRQYALHYHQLNPLLLPFPPVKPQSCRLIKATTVVAAAFTVTLMQEEQGR